MRSEALEALETMEMETTSTITQLHLQISPNRVYKWDVIAEI